MPAFSFAAVNNLTMLRNSIQPAGLGSHVFTFNVKSLKKCILAFEVLCKTARMIQGEQNVTTARWPLHDCSQPPNRQEKYN